MIVQFSCRGERPFARKGLVGISAFSAKKWDRRWDPVSLFALAFSREHSELSDILILGSCKPSAKSEKRLLDARSRTGTLRDDEMESLERVV